MAASGSPYDGPSACPFVALELDRDKRSERPDYRHRCFAEPTPAPRSIAHQEAFCLAPGFSACPIFQDWAVRAAARPVGGAPRPADDASAWALAGGGAAAGAGAGAGIEDELPPIAYVEPEPEPEPEPPPPPEPEPAPEPPAYAPPAWDGVAENEQLGAFDIPPASASLPGALTAPESDQPESWVQSDAAYEAPADQSGTPAYVPPPARRDAPAAEPDDEPSVPAFLAGRSARPPTGPLPPHSVDRVTRDEIVPSWEIDGRYGAESADDDSGGSRFDSLLTAIAVVAILALGIAGVIFLPGLLAGNPGESRTPAPSFAVPSAAASALPSGVATFAPTSAPETAAPVTDAPVTAEPEPLASPRTYRIKAGDNLARIARRFDITVTELLAANPQIEDPNHIEVGQVLVIPPPSDG